MKAKEANEVTYAALVDGLCKQGNTNDADKVFMDMPKSGLAPYKFSYT